MSEFNFADQVETMLTPKPRSGPSVGTVAVVGGLVALAYAKAEHQARRQQLIEVMKAGLLSKPQHESFESWRAAALPAVVSQGFTIEQAQEMLLEAGLNPEEAERRAAATRIAELHRAQELQKQQAALQQRQLERAKAIERFLAENTTLLTVIGVVIACLVAVKLIA